MATDYYIEENEEDSISSEFATPFQSSEMPVIEKQSRPRAVHSQIKKRLLKIAGVLAVIIIACGFLWLSIPAQSSPIQSAPTPIAHQQTPTTQTPKANSSGTWTPPQIPAGWSDAGLTTADGLLALQTASIFTEREEGIDFRDIGTRTQHGGTMTAAIPILSPGGQFRFFHNDRRMINNLLFDKVTKEQIVQAAVNVDPQLVTVAVQGNTQFAWVDVSFELFQQTSNNQSGLLPDTHHMSVLLVHVAGEWLVSSYGLDLPNNDPLSIVSPA